MFINSSLHCIIWWFNIFFSPFSQNENKDNETWDWQAILYIIEDLLGGSSAIGNIVMRIFGYVLQNPHVYEKLRAEVSITTIIYCIPPWKQNNVKFVACSFIYFHVMSLLNNWFSCRSTKKLARIRHRNWTTNPRWFTRRQWSSRFFVSLRPQSSHT